MTETITRDERSAYRPVPNGFQSDGLGWVMAALDSTLVRMSDDMSAIEANARVRAESVAQGYVDLASVLAAVRQWKRADALWLAPERQQVFMAALEADLRARGLVGRCAVTTSCSEDRASVGWSDEDEAAYLDAQQD